MQRPEPQVKATSAFMHMAVSSWAVEKRHKTYVASLDLSVSLSADKPFPFGLGSIKIAIGCEVIPAEQLRLIYEVDLIAQVYGGSTAQSHMCVCFLREVLPIGRAVLTVWVIPSLNTEDQVLRGHSSPLLQLMWLKCPGDRMRTSVSQHQTDLEVHACTASFMELISVEIIVCVASSWIPAWQ